MRLFYLQSKGKADTIQVGSDKEKKAILDLIPILNVRKLLLCIKKSNAWQLRLIVPFYFHLLGFAFNLQGAFFSHTHNNFPIIQMHYYLLSWECRRLKSKWAREWMNRWYRMRQRSVTLNSYVKECKRLSLGYQSFDNRYKLSVNFVYPSYNLLRILNTRLSTLFFICVVVAFSLSICQRNVLGNDTILAFVIAK